MKFVFICTISITATVCAEICKSSEYCPSGWAVKRAGKEYAAVTCEPSQKGRKCPKPYSCVYSPCGMSFCCANRRLLDKYKEEFENIDERDDSDQKEHEF